MAKPTQNDKIKNLTKLAEKFDSAWKEKPPVNQPEGSISATQYAHQFNITYFTAKRRLEEMVQRGIATKSEERFNQSYVFFLNKDS
tara:strand:- start:256 stop:513 length:258 start_codon:yes stop_codon:yes gene_type:complete